MCRKLPRGPRRRALRRRGKRRRSCNCRRRLWFVGAVFGFALPWASNATTNSDVNDFVCIPFVTSNTSWARPGFTPIPFEEHESKYAFKLQNTL